MEQYRRLYSLHSLNEHGRQGFPSLKPYPATAFNIDEEERKGGEISDILGIEDTETVPRYIFKAGEPKVKVLPFFGYPPGTIIFENKQAATNLTLLIFRDSFTGALAPFLSLHFKKIVLSGCNPTPMNWST